MLKTFSIKEKSRRFLAYALGLFMAAQCGPFATWANMAGASPMQQGMQRPMDKPQIIRDLEGLEASEGGISQGLRGSFVIKHYVSGPWKGGTRRYRGCF